MKRTSVFFLSLFLSGMMSCNKTNESTTSPISLVASASQVAVGETVAVTVSSNLNASKWTVSPSTATKTYSITTNKTNYFTFSKAGTYTVAVSTQAASLDSSSAKSLDSCWNSAKHGNCVKGVDSASVNIKVTN